MSTWLTESTSEDFFDSLLLPSTDLLRPSAKLSHQDSRLLVDKSQDNDPQQQQLPPASSSPTLPSSLTSTSIGSTASTSSHVLSSFRSVHSLRKLRMAGQPLDVAPRPYSASFSYDDTVSSAAATAWHDHSSSTSRQTPPSAGKLMHVIQELIDTERVYYHDLLLIEEIYLVSAEDASPWTEHEKKALFGPLLNVLDLEKEFLQLLETTENKVPAIGRAFLDMIDRMEQVYCAYCKRHHDVIKSINHQQQTRPAIAAFLKRCNKAMAGRTTSWDLGSLLIKPVQRILKYPLLLQEMVSLMSPPDADLAAALAGIQRVADCINETKRRKDMMDSIVCGKVEQSSVGKRNWGGE
ncbi:Dbl homology domain-containing protein [Dichotomocladium elegans]|nr:Dbl homology domain-containing protein [Dichotomocladium elegans]